MVTITEYSQKDFRMLQRARQFLALLEKEWNGERTREPVARLAKRRGRGHLPKSHRDWGGGVYNLVEAKVDLAKLLEQESPDPEELRTFFLTLRSQIPL